MKNNLAIKIKDLNSGETCEQIPITVTALKKLFLLADIMGNCEIGAITVSSHDDCVIDDIVIPKQVVRGGSVNESGRDYAHANLDAIDKKQVPLGVAHSHGHFDVIHSSIDHDNFQAVLDTFGMNNMIDGYVDFKLITRRSTKSVPGILRAYNSQISDLNLDMRECELSDEIISRIKNKMKIEFLKKRVEQVSSIVFNNGLSNVQGIKRYRITRHVLNKNEFQIPEFPIHSPNEFFTEVSDKYREYCKVESDDVYSKYCYTTDAAVVQVEDREVCSFDIDALVNEVRCKVTVKGGKVPSIFSGRSFVQKELDYEGEPRKISEFVQLAKPVAASVPAKEIAPEPVVQDKGVSYVSEPVTAPAKAPVSEPVVQKSIIPYVSEPVTVPVKEPVSEPVSAGSLETVAAFNYVPQPAVPDSPHSAYRKIVDESKTVQDILNAIEGKAEFAEEKTSLEMLVSTNGLEGQTQIEMVNVRVWGAFKIVKSLYCDWKKPKLVYDQDWSGIYLDLFPLARTKMIAIGHYQEAEECLKMWEEIKRGG